MPGAFFQMPGFAMGKAAAPQTPAKAAPKATKTAKTAAKPTVQPATATKPVAKKAVAKKAAPTSRRS
jgi:hypothetical protein